MNNKLRKGLQVILGLVLATLSAVVLYMLFEPLIESGIRPAEGATLAVLRSSFSTAFLLAMTLTVAFGAVWLLLAAFVFKVVDPAHTSRRVTWALTFCAGLVTSIITAVYFSDLLAAGTFLWIFSIAFSSVLVFYVASLTGTVPAFKYTPVGASRLRP